MALKWDRKLANPCTTCKKNALRFFVYWKYPWDVTFYELLSVYSIEHNVLTNKSTIKYIAK